MREKKVALGLIGKDVTKSGSERIHKFILKKWGYACEYTRVSVDADGFDGAVKELLANTDGFNVTIPYKLDVCAYLDETVADAKDYGAVNTVVTQTKRGYNTDGVGFMQMLAAAGIEVKDKRVLILGAGGAGRSSAVALKKAGAKVYLYQRRKELLSATCEELGVAAVEDVETWQGEIIVNATGIGMHQTEGVSPVSSSIFVGKQTAVDLIYEPMESEFLRLAKTQGLQTLNGASMLFYQAYYADCLYLNRAADSAEAERLYTQFLQEK
jgi:shikimate dehydrogenase